MSRTQPQFSNISLRIRSQRSRLGPVSFPNLFCKRGVSIEYNIPLTNRRVDFILTGKDANRQDTTVIVELKQWQEAQVTSKDAIVKTRFQHGEQETNHPSYQAWSYAALIQDYNQTVRDEAITLHPVPTCTT